MKVKTSELQGAALAYATQLAQGWKSEDPDMALHLFTTRRVKPDADWSQGGPIIEREKIELSIVGQDWRSMIEVQGGWFRHYGPTPLIAAMRCYVASKLGDEVEVLEELTC